MKASVLTSSCLSPVEKVIRSLKQPGRDLSDKKFDSSKELESLLQVIGAMSLMVVYLIYGLLAQGARIPAAGGGVAYPLGPLTLQVMRDILTSSRYKCKVKVSNNKRHPHLSANAS